MSTTTTPSRNRPLTAAPARGTDALRAINARRERIAAASNQNQPPPGPPPDRRQRTPQSTRQRREPIVPQPPQGPAPVRRNHHARQRPQTSAPVAPQPQPPPGPPPVRSQTSRRQQSASQIHNISSNTRPPLYPSSSRLSAQQPQPPQQLQELQGPLPYLPPEVLARIGRHIDPVHNPLIVTNHPDNDNYKRLLILSSLNNNFV